MIAKQKVLTPLARRIRDLAAEKNISIRQLGIRVGARLGNSSKGEALVQNIMAGKSLSPRAENLRGIADELDTTTDWLMMEAGPKTAVSDRPSGAADSFGFGLSLDDSRLPAVPVRGTAAGSHEGGSFRFTSDDVDSVDRPRALAHVKDLFAIYVEGESMLPDHKPGDIKFASTSRPAKSGDTVIVEATDDPTDMDASIWAMIGILVSRTGRSARIEKLNPPRQIDVPFVKAVHRVFTLNELFGK